MVNGTLFGETRGSPQRGADAGVRDPAERPDQEDHVVAQPWRHGRVLYAAGSAALGDRTAVGIEQALQDGQPGLRRVVQVKLGHELGRRARAVQPELARHPGHRVLQGGNGSPRGRGRPLTQQVVRPPPWPDLDAGQQPLKLPGELYVAGGEARRGRAGQAAVAEQQPQRVRVDRHPPVRETHGRAVQGELVPVVVVGPQVAQHLEGGEDAERLAAAAVVPGRHRPQVVTRAQRRRAVLCGEPIDLLLPLRVHADHRRGLAVRPDD